MGDFDVRIPVLENLAVQFGGTFAKRKTKLGVNELKAAQFIFQKSIDVEKVWIVTTNVINAPTTLGNNIRIPPGYTMSIATLIHELTHIWQFQTQGNKYISDSAFHQSVAAVKGIFTGGNRNGAYVYTITPGQSFYRYTAEHQAMIVEDYYRHSTGEKIATIDSTTIKDFERMIGEVRSASPTISDMDRYIESLYGEGALENPYRNPVFPTDADNEPFVPVIRFEYRF